MKTVRLSDVVAPHFYALHRDIVRHGHTYYWLEGGRGSTKSSEISLEIPPLLIKNPDCHAVVLRKVGTTIICTTTRSTGSFTSTASIMDRR